ncbi:MAG TPA: glucans biosynthesis glucosyltransferase MdoH [Planctomycetota bacterium]|nr:glucans biosynthesis glucosyltransferase MdoH [Planctomycetota bacterium]
MSSPRLAARRLAFVLLVAATVGLVAALLANMLRVNGTTPLEVLIFALTVVLLVPLAVSFWMAVAGFCVEMLGGDPLALRAEGPVAGPLPPTALVVPIRNEDPARVLAGLGATWDSLEETGLAAGFEIFVQSDTTDPRRWLDEELAVTEFTTRLAPRARVHYRNRPSNEGRKAGNIADFCARRGDRFRYMIVFDADSVMSGSTLVRLVQLMEEHPEAGLIQAPPLPVNRRTLFGRLQQFGAGAYARTWATGLSWLQGGDGNYYGHNAIVRVAPFETHCRLPTLPGRPPLGGSILSHDFVEAALMRRAGYRVYLVPDLGGSYEEPPPTLIDFAARDRRWCQGNLQHARLLRMPGLHPMSRLHLLLGVMTYLSAPIWILLLLVSTAEMLRQALGRHQYFAPGGSLFPIWEVSIEAQAQLLFGLTMGLLFLPRLLALVARMREARLFGGGGRLVRSGLAEALFSMLLAPVLAVAETGCVLSILLGRSSGWLSGPRDDRGTSLGEALRRHAGTTLLGIVWTLLIIRLAPALAWWMAPVLLGMVLAVPLSMLSSRVSTGEAARRAGLFITPEEVAPAPVLRRLRERLAALPPARDDRRSALERVLADPAVRDSHLRLVEQPGPRDALARHRLDGLVLKARVQGPPSLSDDEQRELLRDPQAVIELACATPGLPAQGLRARPS